MAKTAIVFGALLIALGLGGYLGGDTASWTALIPAAFGLLILRLGLVALRDAWRKNAMHAAVIVGLLGFFATASSLGDLSQLLMQNKAVLAKSTMAVLCGIFVVLSVKSFVDARLRRRRPEEAPVEQGPAKPEP